MTLSDTSISDALDPVVAELGAIKHHLERIANALEAPKVASGYYCLICGAWVPSGILHACGLTHGPVPE
jgi:hypothetical protein